MLFTKCNLIGCPGIRQGSDESKKIRHLACECPNPCLVILGELLNICFILRTLSQGKFRFMPKRNLRS